MKTFSQWLEAIDYKALFNYAQQIAQNPNLDDIKTLGNMMAREYPMGLQRAFADIWPSLQDAIAKLSPEEQEEAQIFLGKLGHQDPHYAKKMITTGWHPHTSQPYKFENPRMFQDTLEDEMERQSPDLEYIQRLVDANREFFEDLGVDYMKRFKDWFQDQIQKRQAQPTIGDMIKQQLRHEEPGT